MRSSGAAPAAGAATGAEDGAGADTTAGATGDAADGSRLVEPDARGPQPAERLVDRCGIAELRVVREQCQDVVVMAEHVVDEAVQRTLRPDLDEHAGTRVVQSVQSPLTNCTGDATCLPR